MIEISCIVDITNIQFFFILGILIAKKNIFQNSVPEVCGGGSVFFVSRDSHRYLQVRLRYFRVDEI